MSLARAELWNLPACAGGARLSVGGFLPYVSKWSTTRSLINPEAATFSLPGNSEAAAIVRKGLVLRRWQSDSEADWWPIDQTVTSRAADGGTSVDVTCNPLSFLLGTHGTITDPTATPQNGIPVTAWGFAGLTLTEMLTTYVTMNASVTSVLPWVTIGTIEPTQTFDLDVSGVNTLALITQALAQLASQRVLAEFFLDASGAINIVNTIGASAPTFFLFVGKNLQTLKRTIDGSQQYSRLEPTLATLADGTTTAIGLSRWMITGVASNVVTLAGPDGGAGPVGFDGQLNGYYVYVEALGTYVAITDSSAANQTVTLTSGSGLSAGMFLQFRLDNASPATVPTYLDDPAYTSTTPPGIGIVAGQIDQSTLQAVPNLVPNACFRDWSDHAKLPDDVVYCDIFHPAGPGTNDPSTTSGLLVTSRNTDPLFRRTAAQSLHFAARTGSMVFAPAKVAPWYPGQRVALAISLLLTDGWDPIVNQAASLTAYLGIKKSDGTLVAWRETARAVAVAPGNWPGRKALAGGTFVEIELEGNDITIPSMIGTSFAPVLSGDITALSGSALGLVAILEFAPSTYSGGSFSGGTIEGYIDCVSITPGDVPPGVLSEFGEANDAWQATNVGLSLAAPPQSSYEVDLYDLARLNLDLDPSAVPALGGQGVIFDDEISIALDRERLVEETTDELIVGNTHLVYSNTNKRLTDLLFQGARSTAAKLAGAGAVGSGVPSSSSGGSSGTGSPGSGLAAPRVSLSLDGSNVPTFLAVTDPAATKIFYAWSTSAQPTAATSLAGTEIDAPTDFTASTTAISGGDTIFVTVVAKDALGNVSSPGIAHVDAPVLEPGTLNPNIPLLNRGTDAGPWQAAARYDIDTSLVYVRGGSTRNGGDCLKTVTNSSVAFTLATQTKDFSAVAFIDLQSQTIPGDGMLVLQAMDNASFTPSLAFYLDASRILHAIRTDSAGDVALPGCDAISALPATGGGWLEVIGKIDGSAGAAIAYWNPLSGARVKLFDERALNTVSDDNSTGTGIGVLVLGPSAWTASTGTTNGPAGVLIDDEHFFDRTGISLDDVSGRCCIATTFPNGAGHYTDVVGTFGDLNGEDQEGDFVAQEFLANDQRMSFTLEALDAGVGQVNAVAPFYATRRSDSSDTGPIGRVAIRSGSTDAESADIPVPSFTVLGGHYWGFNVDAATDDLNPSFAQRTDPNTSAAWTFTNWASAEVVWRQRIASSGGLLCQLGVDVSCYPASFTNGPAGAVGSREIPYRIIAGASLDAGDSQGNELYQRLNSVLTVPAIVATAPATPLPSCTYANGSSGIGATLTATGTGALTVDGHAVAVTDYVLVISQSSGLQNGLYQCTTAGATGVSFVLTRATEMDEPNEFVNRAVAVASGATYAGQTLVCTRNLTNVPVVGTSAIGFVPLSGLGAGTLLGSGGGTDSSRHGMLRSSNGDVDIQFDLASAQNAVSASHGVGDDDYSYLPNTPLFARSLEVYESVWVNLNSSSIATELGQLRVFASLGGAEQVRLSLNSSRQFVATRRDTSPFTLDTSTATAPSMGRYGIAWRVRINPEDANDCYVKVWLTTSGPTTRTKIIDTEGSGHATNANAFGNGCGAVGFFGVYGSSIDGALATFDDPVVANPGTTPANAPLANGRWGNLTPNGAGTFQDSTGHVAAKVASADVSNYTTPDSSYNIFTAANKKDSYVAPNVAGDASVILAAMVYGYVCLPASPSGSGEKGRPIAVLSSTLIRGPVYLVTNVWPFAHSLLASRMTLTKNRVTGAALSPTDLNAIEPGWETTTHTSDDTWLMQSGLDYFYEWSI